MHDYDGVSEHLTLGDSSSWPFFLEWYASMQIQRRCLIYVLGIEQQARSCHHPEQPLHTLNPGLI
jgi:hypothetical protein